MKLQYRVFNLSCFVCSCLVLLFFVWIFWGVSFLFGGGWGGGYHHNLKYTHYVMETQREDLAQRLFDTISWLFAVLGSCLQGMRVLCGQTERNCVDNKYSTPKLGFNENEISSDSFINPRYGWRTTTNI